MFISVALKKLLGRIVLKGKKGYATSLYVLFLIVAIKLKWVYIVFNKVSQFVRIVCFSESWKNLPWIGFLEDILFNVLLKASVQC